MEVVTFRRIIDFENVRWILTSRETYNAIGDDFTGPAEEFEVNEHPDIWYVGVHNATGIIGLFTLLPQSRICWELHVVMMPWASTREKWAAARQLPGWLGEHTKCVRLVAAVPACHWPAIVYGTHGIGMKYVGRHEKAFLKNGQLQDLVLLGMPIGD